MMNQKWIGFGKGTKNKRVNTLKCIFHLMIYLQAAEIKEGYEKVEVSDDMPPLQSRSLSEVTSSSLRLQKPNETNLDGIFGILHTVAWTSAGPIDSNELKEFLIEKEVKANM